jgi:hypothetical protein
MTTDRKSGKGAGWQSLPAAGTITMRQDRYALLWLLAMVFVMPVPAIGAGNTGSYVYPFTDPFEATVTGTPIELRYQFSKKMSMRLESYDLDVFPERRLPPLFHSVHTLAFDLAYQKQPAPLIFVIAGTGGSHRSATAKYLQRVFYQAGFHVIALSSPTSYDFITAASGSQYPGISNEDAGDLYRVMQLCLERVKSLISVTDVYLTGYSLGGLQAAFVSYRDEQEKAIGFRKVLLLNPPVNLYTSAALLDGLVGADPAMKSAYDYYNRLFGKFTKYFSETGTIRLDDEAFMFKFQETAQPLTQEELMALIGAAFRFSSAGLVFTVDALNGTGYVVEKNRQLTLGTPLEQYLKRGLWWRFTDYFEYLLIPYWKHQRPENTRENLIENISLHALRDYLVTAQKIGVISNADEIILTQEDIDFLAETFGSRATIFPSGGHLGNVQHRDYVAHMLTFFGADGN